MQKDKTGELCVAYEELLVVDIAILVQAEQVTEAKTRKRPPGWGGIAVIG